MLGRLVRPEPVVSAVFDPAVLTLEGWWRGSFASSPWAGVASAGGSAGRNLTEATNPPAVGAAQNGHAPADFDGTNDQLAGAAFTTFVSNGAGSIWCLFNADNAAADAGAGLRIENPGLVFQDTGGTSFGIGYSSSGVTVAYYDGAYQELVSAAATGAYHLAQIKWDGVNLKLRVDSGAWGSIAAGAMTLSADILVVGKNYASAFFDGRILDVGTAQSALSDGDFDNVKSYVNSRYALAL